MQYMIIDNMIFVSDFDSIFFVFESFDVDVRVFEELFRMLITDLVCSWAFVLRGDDRVF